MDFQPSLTYQTESTRLLNELKAGALTPEEYSQRIDEIMAIEILNNPTSHQEQEYRLRAYETSKQEQFENEQKQKKLREQEKARREEKARRQKEDAKKYALAREQERREKELRHQKIKQSEYRWDAIPLSLMDYKNKATRYQNWYLVLQIAIIVMSIIATTFVGIEGIPRPVIAFFSGGSAIAASLLSTFKVKERGHNYYQAVVGIELELLAYDHRVDHYAGCNDSEAFAILVTRINDIEKQQMIQDLSFWKPEEKPLQSNDDGKKTTLPANPSIDNTNSEETDEEEEIEEEDE